MTGVREVLTRQFDTAARLLAFHLEGLTTDECLWRPGSSGPHVTQVDEWTWRADWPEHEGYDLGPPSIAWTTWHIGFWWSMALDHTLGDGTLTREDISWPGDARGVREWLGGLEQQWRAFLDGVTEAELASPARVRWPFADRTLADLAAWVNVELTKNAAEIGYARFCYAAPPNLG